jgi:tRNA U34 5-methylaminomethyl-2-thiouridine-forming methyltransferase MnmC
MDPELLKTKDGSYTLYLPEMDETYHSRNGAWSESEYVFIDKGLLALPYPNIKVLEVGMGTATNAILTMMCTEKYQFSVDYHTLEPFPLSWEIVEGMGFKEKLNEVEWKCFQTMHHLDFNKSMRLTPQFNFIKQKIKLEELELNEKVDVIYFDAFAPSKQPEVWDINNLRNLFESLNKNGLLVTYCAQGQFKRDMKEVGFRIENPPGPHHKKEMTVGIKD